MSDSKNKTVGGCLCGNVRYESDAPPFKVGHCHCSMCRKSLGSAFGTAAFFKHQGFRFVAGEPHWYASSGIAKRAFCGCCGSPIAYQHRDNGHIAIWVGTLDEPERFEPQVHWYTDTRLSWADINPELPDETEALAGAGE